MKINGKTSLQATGVATAYRGLIAAEEEEEDSGEAQQQPEATLQKAIDLVRAGKVHQPFPFQGAARGFFMMMLSELGQRDELNDLLEFADSRLNPTWERGGLFYPRNDELLDEAGQYVHMDPHSGNSCIGYARLNVENGQKIMWEKPWTREELRSRPYVDGCSLGDGVDFLRGSWVEEHRAVVVTVKAWEEDLKKPKEVSFSVKCLSGGGWAVYVNGELRKTHEIESGGSVDVSVTVPSSEEVDVVVWKVAA